ncbi:hypothetical protein [Sphingomonas sp.]|nr:hypothetical protein [Sphingomonas sp.]
MPRTLAFLAALALTTISLSTTGFASVADGLNFGIELRPGRNR